MKAYKDINYDSGVVGYEYDEDAISVQFKNGRIYKYTYDSAGEENIETMKRLADCGDGLNAFINTTVRHMYV